MTDEIAHEERTVASPPPPRRGFDLSQVTGGLVLVGIGVLLLVAQNAENIGRAVPLGIGILLLVGFLLTRQYAFLVPGGIVTGVGSGILLVSEDPTGTRGPLFLVCLGLGFVAVWLLGLLFRVPENHWWPLIPGGILTGIGALAMVGPETQRLLDYWPVVLVIIGLAILGQAFLQRDRR